MSTMSKRVHIIGPTFDLDRLFEERGFAAYTDADLHGVPRPEDIIDIAVFTGGQDIEASLYNQKEHRSMYTAPLRDKRELIWYGVYKDKPKIGVCRGAQLLNVLNGGGMYQNIDKHEHGSHEIYTKTGEKVVVSSVHHQMMIPCEGGSVIGWCKRSTYREDQYGKHYREENQIDPEVIWIPQDKALCFQGHPEFGPQPCTDYFFNLVQEYIL